MPAATHSLRHQRDTPRFSASSAGLDELRDRLVTLDDEALTELWGRLDEVGRDLAETALRRPVLQPHQEPPPGPWDVWLLMAGRGAGKTLASAHWFDMHMQGPPCDPRIPGGHRASIIAPTMGDAWDACVSADSPSGLKAINPAVYAATGRGGTQVRWPNGATARLFGAYTPEDVERLRAGGNRCAVWAEELAAWVRLDDCWNHMQFGLRIGAHPKIVVSTTPKPRKKLRALLRSPKTALTKASTKDNLHLPESRLAELYDQFAGTRLGRQELEGELLDDIEGAMFTDTRFALYRVKTAPTLSRIVIGVDPPGKKRAECGIVAAGMDGAVKPRHFYVLADRSLRASPEGWARAVCDLYHDLSADAVVFEENNGWDMGPAVIRLIDDTVNVKPVNATKGKTIRAEPVSGIDEQGRLHLVGSFPELEEQCSGWDPMEPAGQESPDRMDAFVWAVSALMAGRDMTALTSVSPGGVSSPSYWRSKD